MSNSFDFEEFKAQAIEKLKAGVPLSGKDGVLAPLLENLLNSALEGEMDSHLDEVEREMGNRRNGHMSKQVQTSMGEITINTPRDRDGTFDPQVVRKREKILADSLADRIIGLYAIGNSTREISDILEEQFGNRISAETISSITDRVLPEIQSWKNRPLDRVYPIVWLDAVHYKVMDEKNRPVTRAIYNVLALTCEGRKELLGMYISKSEGANFWLGVLTDLQNRGVQDILIACVDGLKGFPDAIASVFPQTTVQLCIVHQIRNSVKYVASRNQKEFMRDLKLVYQAVNKDAAEKALDDLEIKWGEDYPIVIKSWRDNWDRLTAYFQYSQHIRRIIYTTNTVEGYHRQLRKVTKNKGVFTSDTALEKLVYLAFTRIRKKWTQPVQNWGQTAQQLAILFFDDIDNLAEPFWDIGGPKTTPKYNLTQFSLHYPESGTLNLGHVLEFIIDSLDIDLFRGSILSPMVISAPFMLFRSFVRSRIPFTNSFFKQTFAYVPLAPDKFSRYILQKGDVLEGIPVIHIARGSMKLSNSPFSLHTRCSLKP